MKIVDRKKQIVILAGFLASAFAVSAQNYYQDSGNPETLVSADYQVSTRKEIVLPQVNGYNVYKADLHTHTVFSDGQANSTFRVNEAWLDGLDIMAVTEHIEYRSFEDIMVRYTKNYHGGKYEKAVNNRIDKKPVEGAEFLVDLNFAVRESQSAAKNKGLLIIPGSEITRNGTTVGHFNALFTTDNNLIYDMDPVQAVRNAKVQGALVMHNHPGWRKTSLEFTETEKVLYEEGLIDGVEVMNFHEFYPGIVDRARERGLFIAANTDVHASTNHEHGRSGFDRPMTLVFAKEKTLESVREALEAKRTLAYGFGAVCGEEQLLKDFFTASVKVTVDRLGTQNVYLTVTNMSSITYVLKRGDSNQVKLAPFHSVQFSMPKTRETLDLTVLNMYSSKDAHPVVSLGWE